MAVLQVHPTDREHCGAKSVVGVGHPMRASRQSHPRCITVLSLTGGSRESGVGSRDSPGWMPEREGGVHSDPWIPRAMGRVESEDDLDGPGEVMTHDQLLVPANGVSV
jgi:hypothetical protein